MPSITHYQHYIYQQLSMMDRANITHQMYPKEYILANNFRDPIWEQRPPRILPMLTGLRDIPPSTPSSVFFHFFLIWDAITTCKWSDTNISYCLCIFSLFHWTSNICPFTISRPPGWFTQTHKMVWPYMGKTIHEWPCEVVLKRMTQSGRVHTH
jgi:hypothetical protein